MISHSTSEIERVFWTMFREATHIEQEHWVYSIYCGPAQPGSANFKVRQAFINAHKQYKDAIRREREASERNIKLRWENNQLRQRLGEKPDKAPRGFR